MDSSIKPYEDIEICAYLKNAEIINDENGRPYINFLNTKIIEKIEDIDISISHCKEYAVATVVVMYK